jgi:tRNA pseudouridine55 synthase
MSEGFIIVNKPKGITSFGVVATLRKITQIKRIGHCGTLDPLATGVLICAIGRSATKNISRLLKSDKKYIATIELGKESDTYDAEGEIISVNYKNKPTRSEIRQKIKEFEGDIMQVPPIYSAKKIEGKRAYSLARKGKPIKLEANSVTINSIKILSYKFPILKISIDCGSGTYIRSLANDLGRVLKTGAYIKELERTKVGKYGIKMSHDLNKLDKDNWVNNIFSLPIKKINQKK